MWYLGAPKWLFPIYGNACYDFLALSPLAPRSFDDPDPEPTLSPVWAHTIHAAASLHALYDVASFSAAEHLLFK
jgi:hypothetical protein